MGTLLRAGASEPGGKLYPVVRRGVVVLLVLAGCAAPLPKRLVDDDPAVRERAEKEWSALPPARQFEIMREGLRGGDKETREVAALTLDPRCLKLEEIRLQMAVLVERPLDLWKKTTSPRLDWVKEHYLPVGSPDVPRIWEASLRAEPSDEIVRALSEYHRAALPSHIPVLVAALQGTSPDLFEILWWQLECLADDTDEHRADVARGLLHTLSRLRSERPGGPPPRPLSTYADKREVFRTLAEATWGLAPDGGFGRAHIDAAQVSASAPQCWLHRWAKEIELTVADRPFLARVASEADPLQARVWAVRRLAELGDDATLRKVAAGDDDAAVVAAAALAKSGDRERLDELLAEGRNMTILWYVDRERARQEWIRQYREEQEDAKEAYECGDVPWTQTGLFPEDPDETEAEWGFRIAPSDLAWIGEQLSALGAPPELLAWYYADANPDALTAEVARRVLKGLRPPDPVVGSWPCDKFLGLAEVRDRAAVVDLLDRWGDGLLFLAKLGETGCVEEMLEAWDQWDEWEQWTLGRVHDPRVEAFLKEQLQGEDPSSALDALATFHGLKNPGFWSRDEFVEADWTEEPFAGARQLIADGRPVEAVLHLAESDDLKEWAAATLAGVNDPAAIAFLRRMREEQWRGIYWVATAALATSGDADAMAEWRAFLAEDRIWLIDSLQEWNSSRWSILTAGGDGALVRHWVSRINTNCCLKYYAYCALYGLYPTVPLGNEGPGDWGQKGKTVRAWLDGHRFKRSEILGGLVPAAPNGR